jgi:hypothetical protein
MAYRLLNDGSAKTHIYNITAASPGNYLFVKQITFFFKLKLTSSTAPGNDFGFNQMIAINLAFQVRSFCYLQKLISRYHCSDTR